MFKKNCLETVESLTVKLMRTSWEQIFYIWVRKLWERLIH